MLPILFVTTGIMESLTFEGTKLDPKYNRIIIDEAHVTIEANPSIELGIALARKRGVKIDYMSATVDPSTLQRDVGVKIVYAEAQRFPIHLTNLNGTVEDRILHLVRISFWSQTRIVLTLAPFLILRPAPESSVCGFIYFPGQFSR